MIKKQVTKSVSQMVHVATPVKAHHNGFDKKGSFYNEEKVWELARKIPAPPEDLFEPKISETAHYIGQTRYAKRNEKGEPVETDKEMFWRVAYSIACADLLYESDIKKMVLQARRFYDILASQQYTPNTPTMLNAGKAQPQMSACFVLPIDDNMYSIGKTMVDMALIHKSGGGTGFSFSRLRPYGDVISSSGGFSTGPCAFLEAYNAVTSQIKQGGVRRGANMGIMHITHPDILRFAVMKVDEFNLTNFNISVTVTEDWMKQVEKDKKFTAKEPEWDEIIEEIKLAQQIRDVDLKLKKTEDGVVKLYDLVKATTDGEGYELISPRDGKVWNKLNAYKVFLLITKLAWQYGDPGMILIDRINASGANPTPHLGQIESTNPCVTGNTLISTAEGLIPMKEVVESHFESGKRHGGNMALIIDQRTVDPQGLGTLPGRAIKFFDNGVKDTLKLITKSGFELEATFDHQVLTPVGWVKLQDLKVGENIMIQSGEGGFSQNYDLSFTVSDNRLPTRWTKQLGQVLGWLVGDGWIRTGDKNCRVGFTFGRGDQQTMMYLQGIINNWYGRDIKPVKRLRNTFHLSYHGKKLIDFFLKLGAKPVKAGKKQVPISIYTAPKEAIIGFLQGLFTSDGTVNFRKDHSSYVRLTSKSKDLLRGVQLLLINLGIFSKVYNRSRKPRTGVFTYTDTHGRAKSYTTDGILYELEISRQSVLKFIETIGFLIARHQDKIDHFFTKTFYTDKFEDKVAKIIPVGKQRVYDLTEEKSFTFLTNGIVSFDCGEQPLLPYDACTLGSINVGKFIKDGQIDFEALGEITEEAIHFLDNVLDMNNYPIPEIKEMTGKIRRVGLGVMGFADLLYKLGIGYNTEEGLRVAEEVMECIQKHAKLGSVKLANTRGVFPAWHGSIFDPQSPYFRGESLRIRNSAVTTIAPTGTIAMLADASSGIEPYFALSYAKNTIEGKRLFNANPLFLEIARKEGFYSEDLLEKIEANNGSVQGLAEIPETWQKVFVTTKDISPDWHVRMQAAFQKQVDNAISKTINFPNSATVDDVRNAYMMVYETDCKGITIYRDGSRTKQILEVKKEGSYYDQLAGKVDKPKVTLNGRPVILRGRTYKVITPVGEAFITVNRDETDQPFEVFLTIGKAGMHIAADAEAIGRLTSLALRVSRPNSKEVAGKIVNQLRGIGGASQVGFGKDRVMSLADGVAKILAEDLALNENRSDEQTSELIPLNLEEGKSVVFDTHADLCPSCGQPSFIFEEGCKKCESCGYSVC